MSSVLLLADERSSAWLTPVWLYSAGFTLGVLLFFVLWGLLLGVARIPFLARAGDDPRVRFRIGLVLTAVVLAAGVGYTFYVGMWSTAIPWWVGDETTDQSTYTSTRVNALLLTLVLVGVAAAPIGFGLAGLTASRRRAEIVRAPWEGFLFWVNAVGLASAGFFVLGVLLWATSGLGIVTVVDQPQAFLQSLVRLPKTGTYEREFFIPLEAPREGMPVEVAFEGREFRWIQFEATQPVDIAAEPITSDLAVTRIYRNVLERTPIFYTPVSGDFESQIPNRKVDWLYVRNLGDAPARLRVRWSTAPAVAQAGVVPLMAIGLALVSLTVLLFVSLAPKMAAIAQATFKTEVSQPIFLILVLIGLIYILLSIYIPYYTLGDDIKVYKESGLTIIRVMGIFLAIWAASKSVAEEIEGRTALTVLSKPIGRVQFVLGKFVGIVLAVACLFLLLGFWFAVWTSYKPVYDSVETAAYVFEWQTCFAESLSTLAGLTLAFCECVVFVAISVAISTRVGVLPNFLICFSIYVLGHLTPNLIDSNVGQIEQVRFVGQVISILLPVLEHFDITAAIAGGAVVPLDYIGWAAVYCVLYSTIMMLLGLVFFQDRDLA